MKKRETSHFVRGKLKNQKGFTVLELLVVTAMMVVLLLIFLVNFQGFDSKTILVNQTDEISSVLRRAQILSLTGQTVDGIRYNFGIHFEECPSSTCNYVLFYDADGENDYDVGEEYEQGVTQFLVGIYIDTDNLKLDDVAIGSGELDVVFRAPGISTDVGEGIIYFNNTQTDSEAKIIFSSTSVVNNRTITINRLSGQVDIQ